MRKLENWIAIIGAIGLGSSLTVIFQWLLSRSDEKQDRRFTERKEAYIGLWVAMHRSEIEQTEEAALHVGHWAARCQLVAPEKVRVAVQLLIHTSPNSKERKRAVDTVLTSMRHDLKIA